MKYKHSHVTQGVCVYVCVLVQRKVRQCVYVYGAVKWRHVRGKVHSRSRLTASRVSRRDQRDEPVETSKDSAAVGRV